MRKTENSYTMTTKAIQLTATRILAGLPSEQKELLQTDLTSRPQKVADWVARNISTWSLKTALANPTDSATTTHKQGLHEVVEVYSPDIGNDCQLLIAELQQRLLCSH